MKEEKKIIINLEATEIINNQIKFKLPKIKFRSAHVNVRELFIQWPNKIHPHHGIITSTLVDLGPENSKQQLLFFVHRKESSYTYWSPTQISDYKIQCSSLDSSVFRINLSWKDGKEKENTNKIEKIYLQIELNGSWF